MSSDLDKIIAKLESNPTQKATILKAKARLVSGILSLFYDTRFYGLENLNKLSPDEPNIIAWRHLAKIDPFLALVPLVSYSGHEVHALAKQEAFNGKGLKGALERAAVTFAESIPLDRKKFEESFERIEEVMANISLYPAIAVEGTRSLSGSMLPVRPAGISKLLKYGAKKILPVSMTYNESKIGKKPIVLVNIGNPVKPLNYKMDMKESFGFATELQGIMGKLNVITVDHVVSILLTELAQQGISEVPNDLSERVYPLMSAIKEMGYRIFPEIGEVSDLDDYVLATTAMLEQRGIITPKGIDITRTLISFEDYMEKLELNGVKSVKLKRGDLSPLMESADKRIARGYKSKNTAGYLVNNAGKEVVQTIRTVLKT